MRSTVCFDDDDLEQLMIDERKKYRENYGLKSDVHVSDSKVLKYIMRQHISDVKLLSEVLNKNSEEIIHLQTGKHRKAIKNQMEYFQVDDMIMAIFEDEKIEFTFQEVGNYMILDYNKQIRARKLVVDKMKEINSDLLNTKKKLELLQNVPTMVQHDKESLVNKV